MDISKLMSLIPEGWPHSVFPPFEKKELAERVVQGLIVQIQSEPRNPTQWEMNCITRSIVAIREGMYVLAVNSAMDCFAGKSEVSKPDEWWDETKDHQALDKLDRELARLKGQPPTDCFTPNNR